MNAIKDEWRSGDGSLRLILGDCSEKTESLESESVDLIVTSPPYDDLREYGGHSWDFDRLSVQMFRVLKPGGVVVWIVQDATRDGSRTLSSMRQAIGFRDVGFLMHDVMIWSKDGFTAVGSFKVRYPCTWEYMFVLSKGKPKTFNPICDRRNLSAGSRKKAGQMVRQSDGTVVRKLHERAFDAIREFGIRFNVWNVSSVKGNREEGGHPAPFPKSLVVDHVVCWSNSGDVVLDPFMGSGTTGVACVETGRRFVGIEIEQKYFEHALNRVRKTKKMDDSSFKIGYGPRLPMQDGFFKRKR